jgi:hypothetical protein
MIFSSHNIYFPLRPRHSGFAERAFIAIRALFGNLEKGLYGTVARAKALVNASKGPDRFDSIFGKAKERGNSHRVASCSSP